jgi:predicted O-methyltransferase YrrM
VSIVGLPKSPTWRRWLTAEEQSKVPLGGEHSRPGGLIVADNVVRDGTLADRGSDDPVVQAQRRLHEMLAAESRLSATTIQTVGAKGYDGFTIALVNE